MREAKAGDLALLIDPTSSHRGKTVRVLSDPQTLDIYDTRTGELTPTRANVTAHPEGKAVPFGAGWAVPTIYLIPIEDPDAGKAETRVSEKPVEFQNA